MRIIRTIIISFLSIFAAAQVQAVTIKGKVVAQDDEKPVVGAYVSFIAADSITAMVQTGTKGEFTLTTDDADNPNILLLVNAIGFKDKEVNITADAIKNQIVIPMEADRNTVALDEVVVTADKSNTVKRTANGQIFYLSDKAKSQSNPFIALQEIPLLVPDINNSQLKTVDGNSPLVLINGNLINSGVNPISPANIESVEVINVVPARYLQMGVKSIVNIRLKKTSRPYVWTEVATRHDGTAPNKGFGVWHFEIGNKNYSIYGRTALDYTNKDKTESDVKRSNVGYSQSYMSRSVTDGSSWLGELLFKWTPNEKDYLAARTYVNIGNTRSHIKANGDYETSVVEDYKYKNYDKNKNRIITGSLYYKHSFGLGDDFEIRASFNHNANDLNSVGSEWFGLTERNIISTFRNSRNSGNLDIDYGKSFESGMSMSFGSHTTGLFDRINQVSMGYPIFRHRQINEYLFGSFGGRLKNIYYNLSAGIEAIWLKAGDVNNDYVRPRVSASATWNINPRNSLQLSYQLTNDAPNVSYLNPYNTSTDSLVVTSGNPYLMPQINHDVYLRYTFNHGRFYLYPTINYYRITDIYEAGGYTENGIYHNTYVNRGSLWAMDYGMILFIRFKWGYLQPSCAWKQTYYPGIRSPGRLNAALNFTIKLNKRIAIYGGMNYVSRRKSARNIIVREDRPNYAEIQVNYNFTPDFYIALGLSNFTGILHRRTTVNEGTYHSVTTTRLKSEGLRPWLLVRYTFRKNPQKKMKLQNDLFKSESGINLKN